MNGKHMTDLERFYMEKRLAECATQRAIAKELGVSPSTISREKSRNTLKDFNGLYSFRIAKTLAAERHSKASRDKAFAQLTPEIRAHVRQQLARGTSPEVISGVLKRQDGVLISKNTLYRFIAQDRRNGGVLYQSLPHRGMRYRYTAETSKGSKIINRVGIEHRPAEADLKAQPGHFEIDTVFGKDQKSFLLTAVDKATKSLIVRKLPDKRAETVVAAFQEIIGSTLYTFKTLTSDNGTEFAAHEKIAKITGAEFFFAQPYHSWERGLNEHTNGLLRWFYPKGTDFNLISDEEISRIEHILNTRGRKSLGFRTPNQVFLELLQAA
jgi:IS30 family transposase